MRVEIEEITITIGKREVFDIINCLTKSIDTVGINKEYPEAVEFASQLRNIFMNSVKGIHF